VVSEALPAIAVEPSNDTPAPVDTPAPTAVPEANGPVMAALPVSSTIGRQPRLSAPVTPSVIPRGSAVTGLTTKTAAATVATPAAAVAVAAAGTAPAASITALSTPPAATAAPSGLLVQVNTAVVKWFNNSANWLAGLPGGPVSDLLQGALLLVRRNLFNQIPTIDPVQIKTTVSGQILGTLGAVDPEGDALTYSLTEAPKLGTVQVSPDGTYTYTPGADFSEGDSFSVAVNDGGFNILDPLGNWRPAQATVEVWGEPGGPPEGVLAKPLLTRAFVVRNLTSAPLELNWTATKTWATSPGKTVTQAPAQGTVFNPGETATFVLVQYAGGKNIATAEFRNPTDGTLVARTILRTETFGSVWGCDVGNCDPKGNGPVWDDSGTKRTVLLLDPPGTVISLPSGQGQKQADVLNQLCSQDGNPNSCTFKPKSFDDSALTPWKQSSTTYTNTGTTTITRTLTSSSTQTTSSTLGASVTAKGSILKIVELSVTASASRTWTSTYTFTDSIQVPIAPGQKAWLETRDPITRVTGDFFVTLGNTTWNLYDVSFDSPDASGTRFGDVKAVCTNARGSCLDPDQVPD
jgi:hypothetical protein